MSKIGKKSISINKNIEIKFFNNVLIIKGIYGSLIIYINKFFKIKFCNKNIYIITLYFMKEKIMKSLWGLNRSLINNMIIGVTKKFYKTLKIYGIGYKVFINKNKLLFLNVGYNHEIIYYIPKSVFIKCIQDNLIQISGCNKQLVGQVASDIRSIKKPEPYKGKGIRYNDEYIKIKVSKKK